MFGIKYFKAEPTEFVRIRVRGKVRKEGEGITAFYMPFRTTIEMVSVATHDHPFYITEFSKDNQEVSLQGGFIYRILDPKKIIEVYNFSIDPVTKAYMTEDDNKLPDNILQLTRGRIRNVVQNTPLERLLLMGDELAHDVTEKLRGEAIVDEMGIDFRTIYFGSILPTPEIAKALEAKYRESLLMRADEAIYERRAQAVEKERAIQENEMKTKIELEVKRKELVELKGKNTLQEAEYMTKAKKKELEIMGEAGADIITAQALLKLGENASKIGNLTITSEILAKILGK